MADLKIFIMKNDFLKGKRVLIAEDDFVNQKLIAHSMQTTGAEFDIAGNGREVIELLMMGKYDLIMMDINMPEMDGFEATKYIRQTLKTQIPIIAMTGWSSKDEGDKFAEVGMNGSLAKPFGLDALYKTLHEVLIEHVAVTASVQEIKEETNMDKPLVDLTMLNELSESDTEYKKTIIMMFLESMPETIRDIEAAYAARDWEALSKSAHYAKSSLSVINVEDLRLLVGRIEMNAKRLENLDQLEAMVKDVKLKYENVVAFLQDEMKKY